jgi:hypothetical protein
MANYIRIACVILVIGFGIYAINSVGNILGNKPHYIPISATEKPVVTSQLNNLKVEVIDLNPSENILPVKNNLPEETPLITPNNEPVSITPKPVVNIPVQRLTPLKPEDYQKMQSCDNGFEPHEFAFKPESLDLGSDYYYGGDYAVFKLDLLNVGNREIKNPVAKVYARNSILKTQLYQKTLDLDLKPNEDCMQYFDFNVPSIKGYYSLTVNLYDDNNVLLLSFYKEVNIL